MPDRPGPTPTIPLTGWRGLAGLLAVALLAAPAMGQTSLPPPSITVQGEAGADLRPDAAQLAVGVEVERPAANSATAEVARIAQALTDAMKADGIDDRDVRTSSVNLAPVYPDDTMPATGKVRLPRGYRASTDLMLTVRPPERAGLVIAHLVDKGATGVEGLDFTSSEAARTRDGLRGDAMREARRKADLYVQALGLRLGAVLEITPELSDVAPPAMFARATKSILAAPTPPIPVVPGTLHLREAVSVRWAIAQ